MLKKDKNSFIQIIEKAGLLASQFKRYEKDVDGHPAFILQLEDTPLFFMARTNCNNFQQLDVRYIRFAPNYPKSEYYPLDGWTWIGDVLESFESWILNDVLGYQEEINSVDLWDQIESAKLFEMDPFLNRSSASFNESDKIRVREALCIFKENIISEFNPSKEQIDIISDRLDYLGSSVDRLNKIDWQGVAISTVLSISIALTLDTEKGRSLFSLFKKAFSSAIQALSG